MFLQNEGIEHNDLLFLFVGVMNSICCTASFYDVIDGKQCIRVIDQIELYHCL